MATDVNNYSYDKLINLTARYNRRLQQDKLSRLPFLDNATGIAQRPCLLYRNGREREGGFVTQLYHYRPHRWKKSKRMTPHSSVVCHADLWYGTKNDRYSSILAQEGGLRDLEDEDSRSTWAAGPDYDLDSDNSDFLDESYGNRRRKRRGRTSRIPRHLGSTGRRRASVYHAAYDDDSNDKPVSTPLFICEVCGMRYRSRAGLNYHLNSQHPQVPRVIGTRVSNTAVSFAESHSHTNHHQQQHHHLNGSIHPNHHLHSHQSSTPSSHPHSSTAGGGLLSSTSSSLNNETGPCSRSRNSVAPDRSGSSTVIAAATTTSGGSRWRNNSQSNDMDYTCDFCLGDERTNKKTGQPEDMLRCSDCGRCAHFSCLQFTANMIESVGTYRWQCIECKTCWLCGTSENDEQMLFCDDCDRGYHLYCLTPPLAEPPDGSWSCQLCVDHFQSSAASYRNPNKETPHKLHSEDSVCQPKSNVPSISCSTSNHELAETS